MTPPPRNRIAEQYRMTPPSRNWNAQYENPHLTHAEREILRDLDLSLEQGRPLTWRTEDVRDLARSLLDALLNERAEVERLRERVDTLTMNLDQTNDVAHSIVERLLSLIHRVRECEHTGAIDPTLGAEIDEVLGAE